MDASKSKSLGRHLPVLTLLLISSAVVIALFPNWSSWLVYDRPAILSGEIWRMFTGHWVHFSTSHLVYDLLAFGIAGWIIESQKLPHFGWLCLLAPWLISVVLLLFEPQMKLFGGLSALATTAIVYLALHGLHDAGPWRWICLATLLGITGKIFFEMTSGRMMFATTGNIPVAVSAASHISGAVIAGLFYGMSAPARHRKQTLILPAQPKADPVFESSRASSPRPVLESGGCVRG
jgi:rhomboid family GlyGly-CTERM serine protease